MFNDHNGLANKHRIDQEQFLAPTHSSVQLFMDLLTPNKQFLDYWIPEGTEYVIFAKRHLC